MNKWLLFLSLFLILLIGCKDDDALSEPDNILYTELSPPFQLTCVNSMVHHPSGCGYVYSPKDTSSIVLFDLRNKMIGEFFISCTSNYQFVSESNPCANYNTGIHITGSSRDNEVVLSGNFNAVKLYHPRDEIAFSEEWSNNGTLMISATESPYSTDFSGNKYLGVKILEDDKEYLGWIYVNKENHLLTVISFAINLTPGNPITAGQTK